MLGPEKQAAAILSKWYIPKTMYVATVQPVIEDGKITGGIGRYAARPALHGASEEPSYVDTVEHLDDVTTVTTLTVTPAHMQGHHWAFPGHKSSRAMEHSIYANLVRHSQFSVLQLTGYESVAYRRRINCGDTLEILNRLEMTDALNGVMAEAQVSVNGEVAVAMKGICLTETLQRPDKDTILFDQLKEGAVQTAGWLMVQEEVLGDVNPLFGGTGAANFGDLPKTGDVVLYYVDNLKKTAARFIADVRIVLINASGKREIGSLKKVHGYIVPKEGS